ncbi:MAG: ATP-binding protein [Anaerolineaceae bacterium]|nr:ATP-binding protein [Anaerolineaceae bacterium]
MYQFYEYFDPGKRNQPYTSAGEELEDYLRLLDMVLESYLEYKGMGSNTKLFSRGLVITESELLSYFDMPPYFRERDICDPVLTVAADAAFEYIAERVKVTYSESADSIRDVSAVDDLLRIEMVKESFNLTRTELVAVLLALAVEIDRRYERIYGYLQDDVTKGAPTTGLLHSLMARITNREGSDENIPVPLDEKMFTYFFIRKDPPDNLHYALILQPLMKKMLIGHPDPGKTESTAFLLFEEEQDIPLFFTESYRELPAQDYFDAKEKDHRIYIANEDEDTVLHLLYKYCKENQNRLYVLDSQQVFGMQDDNRRSCISELFLRIKLFRGRLAIRYVSEEDQEKGRIPNIQVLLNEISKIDDKNPVFVYGDKDEPGDLASMSIPVLKIPESSAALREEIWEYFLTAEKTIGIGEDVNIPDLADCYELPYGKVKKVVSHTIANAKMKQDLVISRALILDSLRQMNQVDFSGLATYVNPVYSWDDITITDAQKELMQTACNRYRLRNRIGEGWGLKRKNAYGNGVSVLLYGPPGTGKTMAAQVIANELTLPLYRVDISQISSKYIGETEKNLGAIFNAAAKANVILFFDEADALFSKRTDVSDSHDKYANNETAFLLQKIEEYNGMSILSTNYYNNFDDAFVRRITYAVHMERPDAATRYTLWTTILPNTAKVSEDIDFHFFAEKFDLSGSNIKAILFNAAYMAGAEGVPVNMKHIIRSMEYEFNKLGKLVHRSDFGDYSIYLSVE